MKLQPLDYLPATLNAYLSPPCRAARHAASGLAGQLHGPLGALLAAHTPGGTAASDTATNPTHRHLQEQLPELEERLAGLSARLHHCQAARTALREKLHEALGHQAGSNPNQRRLQQEGDADAASDSDSRDAVAGEEEKEEEEADVVGDALVGEETGTTEEEEEGQGAWWWGEGDSDIEDSEFQDAPLLEDYTDSPPDVPDIIVIEVSWPTSWWAGTGCAACGGAFALAAVAIAHFCSWARPWLHHS